MKSISKLILLALTTSVLAACSNNSEDPSSLTSKTNSTTVAATGSISSDSVQSVDSFRPPANVAAQESPMKARDMSAAPVATNVSLGAPLSSQAESARKNNETASNDNMGKPLQIGFGRNVAQTSTATATQQLLAWKTTASGGQVAAINFNSTGAKGIRIGLLVTQLPETATLRFYAKGATTAFEVKGAAVLEVIAKNLAAGDKTDEGRTYWLPAVDGADATVEIELPSGISTSSVAISVPSISHIFMSGKEITTATAQLNYAGDTNYGLSCQIDVTCSTPIPAATDAVVHLRYIKNSGTYICSGTMLNDTLTSATPYLLTANHCINNQTVASTLTSWFKYRSTTCNDGTTGEYYPLGDSQGGGTGGGSDLLYTAYATDSTLLKLRAAPPVANVLFAGWDATTAPAVNTNVHSIHHPQGDQQRLSRGAITSYSVRDAANVNTFYGSNVTAGTILDVTITTGLTEGGSSGSGLFKGTDSNPQVIGQLFGGSAPVCGAPKYNVYGRFDVAFKDGMNDWLAPTGRKVKYDFNASGKSDIVWTGLNSGGTFLQVGKPVTTPKLLINTGISTVHSGDFNGDGHADIVYTSANGQQIEVVLLKNGYRMSSQFHSPSSSWPLAGVGDFDGDGKSDLIFRNPVTGQIIYWLMNGTSIKTNSGPKPVSQYWFIKGLGDVNGDGKDDVVWMNPWTGEQAIHLMNGTSYTLAGYQFVAVAWEIHGVGDLNGDGKADIIWRYPLTGQVFIYFMNGGTIASTASYGVAPSWKIRQMGDYDGDGKSDVLWQNESTNSLIIHHMNGGAIKSSVSYQLDESLVKIQ